MAKQALLDLLESYIGKYVKNLDAESLNLAIWSGKIELNSLEIDADALNSELDRRVSNRPNLAIPIRIVSGTFESLEIDIPWTRIKSRPVVLRARGLKVVVEPFDRLSQADFLQQYYESESKRTQHILEARREMIRTQDENRLKYNELKRQAELGFQEEFSSSESESMSFTEKLVQGIIDNVQIEIENVEVLLKGPESTAGVVLGSFILVTSDARGNKKAFVNRSTVTQSLKDSFLYKVLQINGLGVYMDEKYNETNIRNSRRGTEEEHSYILDPLSLNCILRKADRKLYSDYAKIQVKCELPSLSILVSKNQLESFHDIADEITASNGARPLFPEYRPLTRVTKETAKEWWHYARRCIGRINGRRLWLEFYDAFRKCRKYRELYKRAAHHQSCDWLQPLSQKERNEMEEIEEIRTISTEGIMIWRDMADIEIDSEKKAYEQEQEKQKQKAAAENSTSSFIYSYIFGTKDSNSASTNNNKRLTKLPLEQLKEVMVDSMRSMSERSLGDSKLYDIHFMLSSFRVNLASCDDQNMVLLEMDDVKATFQANHDGSFEFDMILVTLIIRDMVTPKSFYPVILERSTQINTLQNIGEDVFHLRFIKNVSGHQKLTVKLSELEARASPRLFVELHGFFSRPKEFKSKKKNPSRISSLSGSVDVFYDALEFISSERDYVPFLTQPASPAVTDISHRLTDDISHKLADAWKAKQEEKNPLELDFDLNAPRLLIPDNISDPNGSVLVFDLGHVKFRFGEMEVPKIQSWFQKHSRPEDNNESMMGKLLLEKGKLEISNLTFLIEKVHFTSTWGILKETERLERLQKGTVIEPYSISLDVGVENDHRKKSKKKKKKRNRVTRLCAIGSIPNFSLKVSPDQVSQMYLVFKEWSGLLEEVSPPGPTPTSTLRSVDRLRVDNRNEFDNPLVARRSVIEFEGKNFTVNHFSMSVKKLSVAVVTDEGDVDANIVSVSATVSNMADDNMLIRYSMGYFWVLSNIRYNNRPRNKELIIHSFLPRSSEKFVNDDEYDILEDLKQRGISHDALADITFIQIGSEGFVGGLAPMPEELDSKELYVHKGKGDRVLSAKFSSLYLHINPAAIQRFISLLDEYTNALQDSPDEFVGALPEVDPFETDLTRGDTTTKNDETKTSNGTILALFQMRKLEVSLNSARDSLPLYVMTMKNASFNVLISKKGEEKQDIIASMALGDLTVHTADFGRTQLKYRTMVGLAPGLSKSLLSLKYYDGPRAMNSSALKNMEFWTRQATSYVIIDVSPMRMVYIEAQVRALIDYINQGILGNFLAAAATSTKAAVSTEAEVMQTQIRATGFYVLLPQSAYNLNHFGLDVGSFTGSYILPTTGSASMKVALSDVILLGTDQRPMQDNPVKVSINASLPLSEVVSAEDQATKVTITISDASVRFSKSQYEQLMLTLDQNLGELDMFLRDDSKTLAEQVIHQDERFTRDQELDNNARMYVDIEVSTLSIEICGLNRANPIARMAVLGAKLEYQSFPDQSKSCINLQFGNLLCDDLRPQAAERQYRSLVSHWKTPTTTNTHVAVHETGEHEKIIQISYESYENGSSKISSKIGSTNLVLIPDAISAILDFVKVDGYDQQHEEADEVHNEEGVGSAVSDGVVKANSISGGTSSADMNSPIATMALHIETSRSSAILVDLGSEFKACSKSTHVFPHATDNELQTSSAAVGEIIVFDGALNTNLMYAFDKGTGEMKRAELQLYGMELEIYTAFGLERQSPIQILEPIGYRIILSIKVEDDKTKKLNIKINALSALDISFSMGNVALINAIISSLIESFQEKEKSKAVVPLRKSEALRIKKYVSEVKRQADGEISSRNLNSSMRQFFSDRSISKGDLVEVVHSMLSLNIDIKETKVTFINDMQGLNEALFRITFNNFVAGGGVTNALPQNSSGPYDDRTSAPMQFDFHLNILLLADYFDDDVQKWNILLLEPWKIKLKCSRKKKPPSIRLLTAAEIDFFSCNISLSEQFLENLVSATRIWSIYSMAISSAVAEVEKRRQLGLEERFLEKKGAAASAARNWITTLPYGLDNHSGVDVKFVLPGCQSFATYCLNGSIQYFRFNPPSGKGLGGKRLYGQDSPVKKALKILIKCGGSDYVIEIGDVDATLGQPQKAHDLENGRILLTSVLKEGKTTVVRLSSTIQVFNQTSIPFSVSLLEGSLKHNVGVCQGRNAQRSLVATKDTLSKPSEYLGIPVELLSGLVNNLKLSGHAMISVIVSPLSQSSSSFSHKQEAELYGTIQLKLSRESVTETDATCHDIPCRAAGTAIDEDEDTNPFVLQITEKRSLVNGEHQSISIYLQPRAKLINKMPMTLSVRTPIPGTFSYSSIAAQGDNATVYVLEPGSAFEIFNPGQSVAISLKCSDSPIARISTGWMEGGWVHLPLASETRLQKPLLHVFPFVETTEDIPRSGDGRGIEFFIAEGTSMLFNLGAGREMFAPEKLNKELSFVTHLSAGKKINDDDDGDFLRSFYVTICNYAIDHTGDILFERIGPIETGQPSQSLSLFNSFSSSSSSRRNNTALFSSFASLRHQGRITSLPLSSTIPFRLLKVASTPAGTKASKPLCVDDISICEGGAESTPIMWKDKSLSGYFAYRRLVGNYQSEIHIIPEFVAFNGSNLYQLTIRQAGAKDINLNPGKIAPILTVSMERGLLLSMEYPAIGCYTEPMRVESLGHRVAVIKSTMNNTPMGFITIYTVGGARDSFLVVKVGEVKYGSSALPMKSDSSTTEDDRLKFQLQLSELRMTLNEPRRENYLPEDKENKTTQKEFCTFLLGGIVFEWKKDFDDSPSAKQSVRLLGEKSQLSVILNQLQILDRTENSRYPVVFQSADDRIHFIDLCVKCRGSFDNQFVRVDEFILNLNHREGRSEKICISFSSGFAWRFLDVVSCISEASNAGNARVIKWDEKHGGYFMKDGDASSNLQEIDYEAFKSTTLYDIKRSSVSPFSLVLNFYRNPDEQHFKTRSRAANYVIRKLKFKIEKVKINIPKYEGKHFRGTMGQFAMEIQKVQVARMKMIIIMITVPSALLLLVGVIIFLFVFGIIRIEEE